jgi:hypothetical protein
MKRAKKAYKESTMSLLPDDDGLELIHTRHYETRIYLVEEDEMLVRGAVSDMKPPGLYVEGDPDPMEIHQMQLELRVRLPKLEIVDAKVLFETHPHSKCPMIAADYGKLVGLSIARGFTHEIRHLFGGPKGCTHTNALLQAMAPAVVQATWSVSVRRGRMGGKSETALSPEERAQRMAGNLNTCHIWAEDGDHVAAIKRGERAEYPPIPVRERLRALGRDEHDWG